jgi:hypothetical protein
MEEATTTPVDTTPVDTTPVDTTPVDTTPVETTILENTPVMLPLESQSFYTSFGTSTPTIDTVLTEYFSIFPASYFLIIVAVGIMSILLYTLYGYFDK